jgi:hypothetical protein
MGIKSRESIYGSSIRASAERAQEARKEADRLACVAWNHRMLGYKGPAQPSPALGDVLNTLLLSRSPVPWLRYAPDGCADCRPSTEDDAHPRTGTLHAMQGLLAGSGLSVQAQPSGGAASDENMCQ